MEMKKHIDQVLHRDPDAFEIIVRHFARKFNRSGKGDFGIASHSKIGLSKNLWILWV